MKIFYEQMSVSSALSISYINLLSIAFYVFLIFKFLRKKGTPYEVPFIF